MKKFLTVSGLALLFLMVSSTITYLLRYTNLNQLTTLTAGAVMMLVNALLAFSVKKNIIGNAIAMFINAVALGFCIRAWYLYRGFDNSLWLMYLVSLVCVAELYVFYLLAHIPFINRHGGLFFWIFLLASVVGYVLLVIYTKTTYVSTFGYYMIVELAFVFALCCSEGGVADLFRAVTIASFSVLIVAVIVAVIMLSGDGLSLDGGAVGGGGKKKKPPTE